MKLLGEIQNSMAFLYEIFLLFLSIIIDNYVTSLNARVKRQHKIHATNKYKLFGGGEVSLVRLVIVVDWMSCVVDWTIFVSCF